MYFLLKPFIAIGFLVVFLMVDALPSLPLHFLPLAVTQRATSREPLGTFLARNSKNLVAASGDLHR